MEQIFDQIGNAIDGSKKILLSGHGKPDGDCLGSMLALKILFEKSGKKADVFCSSEIPNFLKFLPHSEYLRSRVDNDYDLVLGLDYGDVKRLDTVGCGFSLLPEITFDHHPFKNQSGRLIAIDPKASSTCEIIFDFIASQNLEIDRQMATCLLTGIFADTGSFRHPSATAKTLSSVARLLSAGAMLRQIARSFSEKNISAKSKIVARALSKLFLEKEHGFVYCLVTHEDFLECGAHRDDMTGFPSFLSSVPGIKFSLVLREYSSGQWDASFRALPEGKNVSRYAAALGGGGHGLSAGVRLSESPESFISRLKSLIEEEKSAKIAEQNLH